MFRITYHRPTNGHLILPGCFQTNEPCTTEWVTPTGWTAQQAREAFERRHPGTCVLRCDDLGNPYSSVA